MKPAANQWRSPHIVPSILSADFAHLADDVRVVEQAGAWTVQIDVMDGHFVPNLSVGPVVLASLRKATPLFLDVHLMIEHPWEYIDAFAQAGADLLTVHWEACPHPQEVIQQIKKQSVRVGAAIRPKTPAEVLFPLLPDLDIALVMTVEPGFGGQAFIPEMLEKVRALRQEIQAKGYGCEVQVDGGIQLKTAPLAVAAGATSLVAGSAVYGAPDPRKAFLRLQNTLTFPSVPR